MSYSKYGATAYIVTYSNSVYKGDDCGVFFYVSKHNKDQRVEQMRASGFTVKVQEIILER